MSVRTQTQLGMYGHTVIFMMMEEFGWTFGLFYERTVSYFQFIVSFIGGRLATEKVKKRFDQKVLNALSMLMSERC